MAAAAPGPQKLDDVANLVQTPRCDAFVFSATEQLALELYDQLCELELQKSLVEAQNGGA